MSGPFRGLCYVAEAPGSEWIPKILGTYEMEIADIIEKAFADGYELLVNVGAAEGYYAVAFAVQNPRALVTSFECDMRSRELLSVFAARNDVAGRISTLGLCTPESLDSALNPDLRTLLLCDVEGAEDYLLDPALVPRLARIDILVETHEFIRSGVTARLRDRFSATHAVEEILSRKRTKDDLPACVDVSEAYVADCLSEERPCTMTWLWLTARDGVLGANMPPSHVAP